MIRLMIEERMISMKKLRRKLKELRAVSAILHANMRMQIAGALYILHPTRKRYAKFERHSSRLDRILQKHAAPPRRAPTSEEKRWAELIAKQISVMGTN